MEILTQLDFASVNGTLAPDARRACGDAACTIRAIQSRIEPLARRSALLREREEAKLEYYRDARILAECRAMERQLEELRDQLDRAIREGQFTLSEWT